MALPVKNARITNAYNDPLCTIKYAKGYHTGIDFISNDGSNVPIYAAVDGTILLTGWDPSGWGNFTILRYKSYDIIHAHQSKILVSQGQSVKAGQQIGIMGTTGNSTGVHLHFEVRKAPWTNQDDIDASVFLGIKNERGNVVAREVKKTVDYGILIYSADDFPTAKRLCAKYGNCAIFLRLSDGSAPEDVSKVNTLLLVGGKSVGHANEILLSGDNWFASAVAVGKHMGQL